MAKHKHASLMQQYAKDWAETEQPWKRWEVTSHRNEWVALCGHPYWNEKHEYRRKPSTLTYTITIPEPLREVPDVDRHYFIASPESWSYFSESRWHGDLFESVHLERGLCFATREDAIAAAKAMLPIKEETP